MTVKSSHSYTFILRYNKDTTIPMLEKEALGDHFIFGFDGNQIKGKNAFDDISLDTWFKSDKEYGLKIDLK